MTEFWKSNERHFCEVCKCWMDGKARAIKMHEEGKGHKENYIAQQKALREKKTAEAKASSAAEKQWADIEEAAALAYEKDLIAQGKVPPPRQAAGTAASAGRPAAAGPSMPSIAPAVVHLPPPPPPPAPASVSPWQATIDPNTGATYYYNIQTMATSWTNPDEVKPETTVKAETATDAATAAAAAAPGMSKKERKARDAAAAAAERSSVKDGEESKDGEEPRSKKQKVDADAATVAAAAPVIDEDTGIGRWETVEAAPAPTAEETAAAAVRPRMTPFGMTTPDPSPAAAAAAASAPSIAKRWAGSNLAGDDDADADDDGAAAVDMAQQLRNQFGPSRLISARAPTYEAGTSLLDDGNADASAPVVGAISFKKKRDRSANVRKPVAATNH